ncbi:ATP-binding protein [Dactylosporangium sp. NPDC005555]|uniref:ATP-binding protein n=1 Tax=Dactylosporangium sp. NPDC005555 TaxID=3154889 RepID=UPI00339E505B
MDTSAWRPGGAAPGAVDVDQTFDVDGLYGLRATLAAHASRLGADDEQIEHLLLVASELATNAIIHGGGTGQLRLWHHDTVLYCQVTDQGPGILDPAGGSTMPDPTRSEGGRGLWICRNLTAELSVDVGPDGRGTTVTATLPSRATGHGHGSR